MNSFDEGNRVEPEGNYAEVPSISSMQVGRRSFMAIRLTQSSVVNIGALIREIRDGKCIPTPVRRREISEPNGGVRNLELPTVKDRLVQQWSRRSWNLSMTSHSPNPASDFGQGVSLRIPFCRSRSFTTAV